MAAATVAGFGEESAANQQGSLGDSIRRDLADLDPDLLARLRSIYDARQFGSDRDRHTAYTSLALLLTGPPDFRIAANAPEIPADVQRILGFEELLPEFYQKARIPLLWGRYQPLYEQELAAYRPVILSVIHQTIEYFHIPPRIVLDRSIVVMSDLLGLRNVVHARNLERTYFIVLGPADKPQDNFVELQHEYLHFLIDPLIEKSANQLFEHRSLLEMAEEQPNIGSDFRDRFLLIVDESLIEAVLHRLHPVSSEEAEAEMVAQFRKGYIFFPFFLRELAKFEAEGAEPFPAYLAGTLASIRESEIHDDAAQVLDWERRLTEERQKREAAQEEARAEAERRGEVSRLLSDAGRLIREKSWSEATAQLEKLLEIEPENGNALFYLGQIAGKQQRHEAAASYYSRAEASNIAEPWVRAWCGVWLGRYLEHQRRFEEARRKFEAVLAMGEDLNGAHQAAQESLEQLPPPGAHH